MQIKILLADDHWMIRTGIRKALEIDAKYKIVGEAATGKECLELLHKVQAEILLLDLNMPTQTGWEVLREIRKRKLAIKIVIMTVHKEKEAVTMAIKEGAHAYVLKESSLSILKEAIDMVQNNEVYIDPNVQVLFSEKELVRQNTETEGLTHRENEILILLAEGLLNKEIASKLGISEKTVKNHLSNIFRKIEVCDRTQAAIYAIKHNIVRIV